MHRAVLIMTITMFSFLFILFYPDLGKLDDLENIIYLQQKKAENIRNLLYITVDNDINYDENNYESNNTYEENYTWPLADGVGEVSSVLGYRGGTLHKGWDISTTGINRPLYSISDGVVIRTQESEVPEILILNINEKEINLYEVEVEFGQTYY